jgi:hypothetical protein
MSLLVSFFTLFLQLYMFRAFLAHLQELICCIGGLRLKRDGTSLRKEAEVKGKPANYSGYLANEKRETRHSWPSVTTNNETMCTLRLLAAD